MHHPEITRALAAIRLDELRQEARRRHRLGRRSRRRGGTRRSPETSSFVPRGRQAVLEARHAD